MAPETRMAAIAVSFAAGIAAAAYAPAGLFALASLGAVPAALLLCRRRRREVVLILAAFFLLGGARYMVAARAGAGDVSLLGPGVSAFQGVIASDPEAIGDRLRFLVKVERARTGGRWQGAGGSVLVAVYCSHDPAFAPVHYGDRVLIQASPYPPRSQTNPGRFSWSDYLARHGIYSCASVDTPNQVSRLPGRRGHPVIAGALWAKRAIERGIYRIHPAREASLVTGVVLGSYAYLPPRTFRDFSRTGTLHILAASGYSCFVLLVGATWLLRKLRVPRWRNVVVIALIAGYLLIVGPKPSLARASVMAVLALLALPLSRAPNARNLFFAAAFVVLMASPSHLFDAGFQLSFLSVWALIWTAPILGAVFARLASAHTELSATAGVLGAWSSRTAGFTVSAAMGTAAITLFTAPVVAHYFNYVSLVSIPANVCVAFGVPVLFATGFASAPAAHLPVVGDAVGLLGTAVTRAMLGGVEYLGSLRYAAVSVSSPSVPALAGYYLVLYAAISCVRSRIAEG